MQPFFLQLARDADDALLDRIEDAADALGGLATRLTPPWEHLIRVEGLEADAAETLRAVDGVRALLTLAPEHPLTSRAFRPERPPMRMTEGWSIGRDHFSVIAGPCAVESRDQVRAAARAVAAAGAVALRAGAFKPRTSPWSFQGLGAEGVAILNHVARGIGLPTVTEALDAADVEAMAEYVDVFQVGARNMQNYVLLEALSRQPRPVLLKRGAGATVKEWILAAEYLLKGGNERVVLCERGIRTFETANRYTLDLAGALLARERTWLPVIIDPSHATGRPELIADLSLATLAAGLDGLIIEVHPRPEEALSDGAQALRPAEFHALMTRLSTLAQALGRPLPRRPEAAPPHEVHPR